MTKDAPDSAENLAAYVSEMRDQMLAERAEMLRKFAFATNVHAVLVESVRQGLALIIEAMAAGHIDVALSGARGLLADLSDDQAKTIAN